MSRAELVRTGRPRSIGGLAARPATSGGVRRWIIAYTSSVSGDSIYFVTLSWAASRTFGPAAAGAVLAVGAIPRALLMLAGGVVADRFGPRRVLVGSDLVRCVLVSAAAPAVVGHVHLWVLAALAASFGTVDALFMPAVGALPPALVASDQLARVQGMRVLAVRAANLAGPVLAGVMLGIGGACAAFLTAGALFGASLVMLMTLRIPRAAPKAEQGLWHQFAEGLRYVRHHAELRRLVVVIGLSELCFSGPIAVAVVLFVAERHWSSATAGWILGAFSIGGATVAGAMATLVERLGRSRPMPAERERIDGQRSGPEHIDRQRIDRQRLALAVSLTLTAALLLAWSTVGRLGAIAISAALGATTGVTAILANARLQIAADPRFLGRVTSVTTLCTLGLSPLLFPLVGVVTEAWGSAAFFALCAAVCAAAAAVGFRATPSGRPTAAPGDARRIPARPRTRSRSPRR